MNSDHIRHAAGDAEALQNLGLDWAPIAAIGRMKCEHAWRTAGAEMLEYRALDLRFGLGARSHGAALTPPGADAVSAA